MTKIRTIKRTKNMPKDARYIATDADGRVWAYAARPRINEESAMWAITDFRSAQSLWETTQPKDFRTTLRRIVDPPKKPKRKMIRVWYFAVNDEVRCYDRRALARHYHYVSRECDFIPGPGPIESALIPAPRRKGEK